MPLCPRNETVPQKWVQMHRLVSVNIPSLFLSRKVLLQWDQASARTLQEHKAQSLFTVAQGINSCRDKTINLLQAFPCMSFGLFCCFCFFFSYILLTLLIYPKKCHVSFFSYTGLLFQTISFSPPSSKEDFPVQVLQFRGHLCYKKTHNLSLCSFFNTSFLLSGWRDLDFSKCQNPLSGWLSDQTPRWS